MKRMAPIFFSSAVLGALLLAVGCTQLPNGKGMAEGDEAASSLAAEQAAVSRNPLKNAYFGDLHLHTSYSFDAYTMLGTVIDPDQVYQFAQGKPVEFMGQIVSQSGPPLDFIAVTDHGEWLGVGNTVAPSILAKLKGWARNPFAPPEADIKELEHSAWAREIAAANRNYAPGRFTTFIGYEWTSWPGGVNLHRNVIWKGEEAPYPFSSHDSSDPRALWNYLEAARKDGFESLAIPHNPNWSDGQMFAWTQVDGTPMDRQYALERARNEPLVEIVQNKGQSETHPSLSVTDEFSNFEIWDHQEFSSKTHKKPGSYVRDALGRGLVIENRIGVNPFHFGFAGGSDFHNGLSDSSESAYNGPTGSHYPEERAAKILSGVQATVDASLYELSSGGLTGVWAEANTRPAIFDALRRKETFATSGTRLRVRFFGGWNISSSLFDDPRWVSRAYAQGVPMGGDLPVSKAPGKSPVFAVWAVKDPNGASLDRVQIVKVWTESGKKKEKIFNIAFAGDRKVDPETGSISPVGNSVDPKTLHYDNSIGATELKTIWRDPEFDARTGAIYYVRVLEIPTPRWTTMMAKKAGTNPPAGVPETIQERGWSSPIWYRPER